MGLRSASSDVLGIKEMDCLLPLRLSGGPIFPREIRLSDWSGTLKGLRRVLGDLCGASWERETYEEPTVVENINKVEADVMDDGITCYLTDASHLPMLR